MVGVNIKKLQHSIDITIIVYYNADELKPQDYSSFGSLQENTKFRTTLNRTYKDKKLDRETALQDSWIRSQLVGVPIFASIDPLTRKYPRFTPYQFSGNRPIRAIDLDGIGKWIITQGIFQQHRVAPSNQFFLNNRPKEKQRTGVVVNIATTAAGLGEFDRGGTKLVSSKMLDAYAKSSTYGNPAGTFIAPTEEINIMLSQGLSRVEIASKLGIVDKDFLKGDLIRVDLNRMALEKLNIRCETGQEVGANELFTPGGKTFGGVTEAIVDGIPKNAEGVSKSIIKNCKYELC